MTNKEKLVNKVIEVLCAQLSFVLKDQEREHSVPATGKFAEIIKAHWPTLQCDHETKCDQVVCGCAKVHLMPMSSAGEAMDSWAEHVYPFVMAEFGIAVK